MQALEVDAVRNDLTRGDESCDVEKLLERSEIEPVHKRHYHMSKT